LYKSLANKKTLFNCLTAAMLLALPFLLILIFGNNYLVFVCCISLIYIIATSGLDLLFGYAGQISMGHAAYFAIGAYGSAMLDRYFNIPLYVTIPFVSIAAAGAGALLAYPASKLKFHFLSLATISFAEIIYNIIYNSPNNITNNALGMAVEGISFLGSDYRKWYYFLLVIVIIVLLGKVSLVKSRVGRAFIAIRENTHAADGMGINVRKYKVIAFACSAFLTGLAGALYGCIIGFASPDIAKMPQSVLLMTMLMFGGSGSTFGPICGVVTIEVVLELIRPLQEYQMLFYGALLLIVIVAMPGGLHGSLKVIFKKVEARYMAGKKAKENDREKGGDVRD
jgi:branched-chain amino acid transport system permease protein